MRRAIALTVTLSVALPITGCDDSEKRIAERQKALDEAKQKQKEEQAAASPDAKKDDGPKDPFWENPDALVIRHEQPCPENLWALFKGPIPGGDDETRKANAEKRGELAAELQGKTFIARLRGPEEVKLLEHNAAKGKLPVEMKGIIDCEDSIGRVNFAFTKAKAIPMPQSVMDEGAPQLQMMWDAPEKPFELPIEGMTAAKNFTSKHQFGMEAFVVFKIGKTDVHHKKVKTARETQGEVTIGGSTDDYGAGRLVQADVEAIRIVAHPGPVVAVDTRTPSAVSLR